MSAALALPLVAALLPMASFELETGGRLDARGTELGATHAPTQTLTAGSADGRAELRIGALGLLLAGAYAPRIWTPELRKRSFTGDFHEMWLVNHAFDARLETRNEATWRAWGSVSGLRGWTDPQADALASERPADGQVAPERPGGGQVASTAPLGYEEGRAHAGAAVPLTPLVNLTFGGGVSLSRARTPVGRTLLPEQRTANGNVTVERLVTERDTLSISLRGEQAETDVVPVTTVATATVPRGTPLPAVTSRSASATLMGTWQREMTPRVTARLGVGLSLAASGTLADPSKPDVLLAAEGGLTRMPEGAGLALTAFASLTTGIDRFTGEVTQMLIVTGTAARPLGTYVGSSASLSAGSRTDGSTVVGRADARLSFALAERLALEVGIAGRVQEENRAHVPSFREGVAFVAVVYAPTLLMHAGDVGRPRAVGPTGHAQPPAGEPGAPAMGESR